MRYMLGALLLVIAACGGTAAEPTSPATTAPQPATTAAPPGDVTSTGEAPPTTGGDFLEDRSVITTEDGGREFTTRLGNRIELHLSGDYTWSDPAIIGPGQLVPVNYVDDPGFFAWEVLLEDAGTVTITATGEEICRDDYGCDPQRLEFLVTIAVTEQ